MDQVFFKIPQEMRRALLDMARDDDVTPGQIIRELLNHEIRRRQNARPPVSADERLVAPLRARLAGDLADAPSWDDLQARLHDKGYELREAGGGLALHAWPSGARICKASELGFSYSRLMSRIGAPFPGHGQIGLAERVLGQNPDEDEIALVE